jgi:hypothetical protein
MLPEAAEPNHQLLGPAGLRIDERSVHLGNARAPDVVQPASDPAAASETSGPSGGAVADGGAFSSSAIVDLF